MAGRGALPSRLRPQFEAANAKTHYFQGETQNPKETFPDFVEPPATRPCSKPRTAPQDLDPESRVVPESHAARESCWGSFSSSAWLPPSGDGNIQPAPL